MKDFKSAVRIGFLALVAALTCALLAGCSGQNYQKAEELYKSGDYSAALEAYEGLGDYEDSAKKANDCRFLVELETSILSRMEADDDEDWSTLVNTELAYLDQFRDTKFSTKKMKGLCSRYLEGLDLQKKSLDMEYEHERQIEWQRGMVYRYEVLKTLHDEYSFLNDNKEFKGTYVLGYEEEKALLDAYDAIEKDIDKQVESMPWSWGYDSVSVTVKNRTNHEFSTVFDFVFKDESGKVIETGEAIVESVKPHSSYKATCYFVDQRVASAEWSNYYYDVRPGKDKKKES